MKVYRKAKKRPHKYKKTTANRLVDQDLILVVSKIVIFEKFVNIDPKCSFWQHREFILNH